MRVGIVGHAEDKFTSVTRTKAIQLIKTLLESQDDVLVSGRCPLGGVDVWAEVLADSMNMSKIIHPPSCNNWSQGYKPRNLRIARDSDVVHVIVCAKYPPEYSGMVFESCYHCHTNTHIKSGGCWTAWQARILGKPAFWHILEGN